MNLKAIFVNKSSGAGLYSIVLNHGKSEYEKVFANWFDPRFVRTYLLENRDYFNDEFYKGESLENALLNIRKEVNEINKRLNNESNYQIKENSLDEIFQPLVDEDYKERPLKPSKIKLDGDDHKDFRKSKLRLYAIRISKSTFIVTGGTIKLTKKMKEHADTIFEKKKIDKVVSWLKNTCDITTEDDLIYYYEQ